jgi:hypothetical protein
MTVQAKKRLSGEGHKHGWPPVIRMDEAVKRRVEKIFNL